MAKLIENGIEITAVHNHVLRANPLTFYMHIGGHGDPVKLATAIRTGLAASKTPLTPPAAPASQPAIDLDTAQLDQIIGVKGSPMAAFISSACRAATRSARAECSLLPPGRRAWPRRSASSRPAAARPPSPATSC
jgi:hypothetical protein